MGEDSRCIAESRSRRSKYGETHTVRCELETGHDGLHTWRRDERLVMWGGPARPAPDNTRYRFGKALEAK